MILEIENNINRAKSVLALVQDQFTDSERGKLNNDIIYSSLDAVDRELDDIAAKYLDLSLKEREQTKKIAALSEILLTKDTELDKRKLDLILEFSTLTTADMLTVIAEFNNRK